MTIKNTVRTLGAVALATILAAPAFAAGPSNLFAEVQMSPTALHVAPLHANDGVKVSLSGPGGVTYEQYLATGDATIDLSGLADGQYTYELRFVPVISKATRAAMSAARAAGDDAAIQALRDAGKLPSGPRVQYGYFQIQGGSPVSDLEEAGTSGDGAMESMAGEAIGNITAMDQVILDDLIVDGSACIGFDCVNGENFGFDTLRLKENNLRIKFQDTSASASFPSNDWQITANDSSNGGANKFSIDDIDGGRTPFTIEASAPSHSLYVDDGGRLGFGTSTPVVELHLVDGDSPTLRLEQDGSSGFTPQTWDVAGNETNFFVRDATNGSDLPFKIFPSAGDNALVINNAGDISIGKQTAAAGYTVDIVNSGAPTSVTGSSTSHNIGAAALRIEDTNAGDTTNVVLGHLINNGPISFLYENTSGNTWGLNAVGGGFSISLAGSGVNELLVENDGDINVSGTVVHMSTRTSKRNITPVNPGEVLQAVLDLPVATWEYKRTDEEARHLGPMAEDFYATFGLGETERGIFAGDTAGVALAAIQGLAERFGEELDAKDQMIQQLQQRLEALEQAAQ